LAAGDVPAAREAARDLAANAQLTRRAACLAAAELALGLTALAARDASAWAHLDLARERFSALDMPLETARARLALARAVSADDPQAARDMARAAHADFERLGAAREVDRAAETLRELGVAMGPGKRTDGLLSAREEEVLALLGAGLSNPDIGKQLFISPKTVEHHVGKILGKLGLKNRSAAAAHAIRRGRADSPEAKSRPSTK
jgi:DNA-binding CsgD family transcriptional regulator